MASIDRLEQRIKEIKMADKAVVRGEYVTYSHIKTRKTFSITIEFPEEEALYVLNVLGAPIGGKSKPVAVCLLDKTVTEKTVSNSTPLDTIEGERLRVRAVMLCKDDQFIDYVSDHDFRGNSYSRHEGGAAQYIYDYCNIESRSELTANIDAQNRFKKLDQEFKDWQRYGENLDRM